LAVFDAAIEGGVDLLSFSFGTGPIPSLVNDITAIQKGILGSASPVNLGPFNGTMQNAAPWILIVGASTIDRSFRAVARFGNGVEFEVDLKNCRTIFERQHQPLGLLSPTTLPPLVYPITSNHTLSEFCNQGTLANVRDMVKGKLDGYTIYLGINSCATCNTCDLCSRVANQGLYKFNLNTNCHNLIQRNSNRKFICSHCAFLFFKRSICSKPRDSETEHYWTWRKYSWSLAV
ncbi:unnamed protein product, partial [Prunus brigantina]